MTVATAGTYTANFRVGSPRAGHTVAVTVDGAAGCTVTVPNTGSHPAYATASAPLTLTAGTHVLRLTYHNNLDGYGQSIDSLEIVKAQTAYNGSHAIPGRVQAEDYDNGGQNVAYYDTTAGNSGGAGRLNEAVDVRTINGVTDIAYIDENEWTEYTVTVATVGTYTANFRVGSPKAGHTVAVTVDGAAGCHRDRSQHRELFGVCNGFGAADPDGWHACATPHVS